MNAGKFARASAQRGVAAVEFAIVSSAFFLLLIGVMELGRVLFYMNSAAEATRLGARIAVVCNLNAAGIQEWMSQRLNLLQPENIEVVYNPAGCTESSCRSVTVRISPNLTVNTFIPFVTGGFSIVMPPYSTTLPRESMSSVDNDLCT